MLHSLGGSSDLYRLYMLLYLADLNYLAKYGSIISGDTYVAMKFGPAPFHIMAMFREIHDESGKMNEKVKTKIRLENNEAIALSRHELPFLAESEVECLFETIQQYKTVTIDALTSRTAGKAWQQANENGEISRKQMAIDSGAPPEMIRYIEITFNNEHFSFRDPGFNWLS